MPKYASRSGASTWTLSTLATPNNAEGAVNLAFSPGGARWATYYDRGLDAFRVVGPPGGTAPATPMPATEEVASPREPSVELVRPNPFPTGATMTFRLDVPRTTRLTASVIDVAGRRIAEREFESVGSGTHQMSWEPSGLRPGLYFVRYQLQGRPAKSSRLLVIR